MEFIKAFEEIDTDESGEITRTELEEYMKSKNYKPQFVEKWLTIFDADNSGTITLEEFCNTLGLIPGKKQKERIQRRNTLKQINLETQESDKTGSNGDKDKSIKTNLEIKESDKTGSSGDKNKSGITIENKTINVTIKTSTNSNIKGVDKLNENKLTNVTKDENSINKNNKIISETDEIYLLSKSIDKDEIDMNSKNSSIRIVNRKVTNDTENKEEISEKIPYRFIKDSVIGENDEVRVIAEDPDISNLLRGFVLKMSLDFARKYDDPKEMATNVKRILDEKFDRTWHVVAGRDSYGCLVTHEEGKFIHVRAREWGILMWQICKKS